jgi:hypothetical protein
MPKSKTAVAERPAQSLDVPSYLVQWLRPRSRVSESHAKAIAALIAANVRIRLPVRRSHARGAGTQAIFS